MVASNNIKLLDDVDREQVIVDGGSSRTGQVESTKRLLQQLDTSLGERVVVRLEVLRHLGLGSEGDGGCSWGGCKEVELGAGGGRGGSSGAWQQA